MQVKKQQLFLLLESNVDMERTWNNGLIPLGKEYVKAVYCHPIYVTYMQSI